MRIFDRTHWPWFIFVVFASMAACLLYLGNFHPQQLSFPMGLPRLTGETPGYVKVGATPLGLIFGSIAFAIFIFAGLLGLRKRVVRWRIGTVQRWLRAHIWLTLLTIPLVLLHSNFRLGGPMTTFLMLLYSIVMVSGIYGLVLQHQLPKLMKEKLPTEPVYEQIPHLRAQLHFAARKMRNTIEVSLAALGNTDPIGEPALTGGSEPPLHSEANPGAALLPTAAAGDKSSEALLLEFLDRQALPYLQKGRRGRTRLADRRYSEDIFRFLKLRVAEQYREDVDEIEGWCEERRLLDYQTRLQHWLHGWLFVHVPFSYGLILVTAWHAFVTLFRY